MMVVPPERYSAVGGGQSRRSGLTVSLHVEEGKATEKVVPVFSVDSTQIRPASCSTSSLLIAKLGLTDFDGVYKVERERIALVERGERLWTLLLFPSSEKLRQAQ
ncbi:MAG TPA: hypothetical protein VFN35_08490 [Ktedonobacteraceae bacterium]|nr:hypothetical protein [Ktedonobacteraceae bacterium]